MKLNKSLAIATLGIATLALFPSCQDEDFGYTAQQIKTSKFAQNFENQYGPIDPDQSWDLTNYMTRTAKYDDEALVDYLLQNGGQTRAGDGSSDPIGSLPDNCGLAIDEDGYYHVEPNTIKWLRSFLKEKKNNTDLGSAFSLRSPGNKVAIIQSTKVLPTWIGAFGFVAQVPMQATQNCGPSHRISWLATTTAVHGVKRALLTAPARLSTIWQSSQSQ